MTRYHGDDASSIADEIVEGFADALWVSSWASACDEAAEEGRIDNPIGPGDHIDDLAPRRPPTVDGQVQSYLGARTSARELTAAYFVAREARYDAPKDPEEFGWQLGMRWLGHGTPVGGDREPEVKQVEKQIGSGEFALYIEDDPDAPDIAYSSMQRYEGQPALRAAPRARETSSGINGLAGLQRLFGFNKR